MSYAEPTKAKHILYYSMKSRTDRTNMAMKNKNGDCLLGWGIFRYIYIYISIRKKVRVIKRERERNKEDEKQNRKREFEIPSRNNSFGKFCYKETQKKKMEQEGNIGSK